MNDIILIAIGVVLAMHALSVNWSLQRILDKLSSIDGWLESIDKEINKPRDHD